MNNEQRTMGKILSFVDLNAWQEGHKLVLMTYKQTLTFPEREKFCLLPQMNRAVVSITSNIAEGFTRFGAKDKINFYYMAKASLTELQNQFIICRDLDYINKEVFTRLWGQSVIVHKLITGIIKGVSNFHSS